MREQGGTDVLSRKKAHLWRKKHDKNGAGVKTKNEPNIKKHYKERGRKTDPKPGSHATWRGEEETKLR